MVQKIIVIIYIILTILLGYLSKNKMKSAKDFDGAGLGIVLCVVASAGEWMGGTSTTGVAEYGYVYGISGSWYTIANGVGIFFLAIFFAKLFRSLNLPTVSSIIGKYLGTNVRMVSGVLLLGVMIIVGSSQMIALGTLGETLFHLDGNIAIIALGAIVLIYTLLGGMFAVGYTNIMHIIVMYFGALLALFFCMNKIGGMEELTNQLPDSYFNFSATGITKISSWLIASILGACTAQAGLQPILGAKDERTAVKSSYAIALVVAPFGIVMALLGMCAKVVIPSLTNAKLALPNLLMTLPPVAGGIVIASVFAAVLSTASPLFLSCGTILTRDVICQSRIMKKYTASDEILLTISKISTLLTGVLCITIAVTLKGSARILDMVYFAYSIRGSIFIILLLGIFWKKITQYGAISGLLLTAVTGGFWIYYRSVYGSYPISPYFSETYISILVATVVTMLFSLINRKKSDSKINGYKRKVEKKQ